ncbi:macrophage mannose receptor 1-like [Larimichthys crocea]|uniref:macrophage mannose receptor 1-like n=1 Tax=Larimichthys crocea TaxID=215358 RepID=UPI000F5E3E6B|nr:macrophage mannose receptor 1-like [Larimichthys crocea]
MGNKTNPALTVCLLLMAALSLEASLRKWVHSPYAINKWELARRHCLNHRVDLVTGSIMQEGWTKWLWKYGVSKFWIGLKRSPNNDSAWMDVNIKTGEGLSGGDLSRSNEWAPGESSGLCASVDEQTVWHSRKCSHQNHFYCSIHGNIQYDETDLSWFEASEFCQYKDGVLITVNENNTDKIKYRSWIGLYRRGGDTWSWIGKSQSNYRKWAPGEPSNADCAMYDLDTNKWYSRSCFQEFRFLCIIDNLVLVTENKTWEEALEHCRNMTTPCAASRGCMYRHDLLSLQWSDHSYVSDRIYKATSDEVWTGLRFLAGKWWWANKEELKDSGGLPKCPSQQQHCGTVSKYDTKRWIIRDCSEKRNFVCYRYIV